MQPPAAKRRLQLLPKETVTRSSPPQLPELLRQAWSGESSDDEESVVPAAREPQQPELELELPVLKDSDWANAIAAAKRKDRAWSAVGLVKKMPVSKTLLQCVHEWQGFEREPGRVKLEVLRLQRETARAVLLRSGALLSVLLIRAVGGLRCESDACKWDDMHYALSGVVLTCLIYLDFRYGGKMCARLRPVIRWICAIAATINSNIETARKVGKVRWQIIARVANRKLLQRATMNRGAAAEPHQPRLSGCHNVQGKCCVRNCCDAGDVYVPVADALGPVGRRCWQHAVERPEDLPAAAAAKRRRCATAGCKGQLGQRCTVSGCKSFACGTRLFTDDFGPPGKRCRKHGSNLCTMVGCTRRCYSEKLLAMQDGGHRGARCSLHGGPTCTVQFCKAEPVIAVKDGDFLGPSGPRCNRHSGYDQARNIARASRLAAN
mmetsp:Transcript_56699/g.104977  ORF Transcript_56699/g.104977 Transcript_56699/m.104977 type:complete len:435 (-) Transcript_56699:68-1372(-)